jgi:hypothetical protein
MLPMSTNLPQIYYLIGSPCTRSTCAPCPPIPRRRPCHGRPRISCVRRRRHPPLLLKRSCSMKLIKTTNKLNQGMELNNIEIFYIHGTPIRPWPYAWHNTSRWLTPTQLWILLLYQKNMGIVGNTCKEELDWQSWNNWSHYPHASTDVSLLQGYMKKEKLRARDFSPKLDKSANEIQFQGRKIHFF